MGAVCRVAAGLAASGVMAAGSIPLTVLADHSQRQTFRAGVALVAVDLQVLNRDGEPIAGLTPSDFEVRIDGRVRRIESVSFVRSALQVPRSVGSAPGALASAVGDGAGDAEPRTIVLALDQPSFRVRNEAAALEAATRLIDRLPADDLLGLVAYPSPGVSIAPTRDRAAIKAGLRQFGGRRQPPTDSEIFVAVHEAAGIMALDRAVRDEVFSRECDMTGIFNCRNRVLQVAKEVITAAEMQASSSLNGLFSAIDAMTVLPGRKILVVVSAGVPSAVRAGPRGDVSSQATAVGRAAAAANITMYTLFTDVAFLDAYSAAANNRDPRSSADDSSMLGNGLERVSDAAGGTLFRVEVGPHTAMERILRETAAYYLLGVVIDDRDRDGEAHAIRVSVKRRGVTVRSRTSVMVPKASPGSR